MNGTQARRLRKLALRINNTPSRYDIATDRDGGRRLIVTGARATYKALKKAYKNIKGEV